MNNRTILLFSVLGLLSACGNKATNATSDDASAETSEEMIVFDKLIGLWKNEDGKSYERWTKNADGSYLSTGFQVNDADTIYTERVHVHRENDQWISENTVSGQNEGTAVKFTVTKLTKDEAHFNNPAHDFPTDIHYHLADENTIQAFIAGPNQSGSHDTIPFNFIRVVK
ncbi:MAG: hypothetical protein IPJ74_14255 [Saprospiraceae bacterium]|nr:hypothetical protein [Saprospiraceae bacterium]